MMGLSCEDDGNMMGTYGKYNGNMVGIYYIYIYDLYASRMLKYIMEHMMGIHHLYN
jgi:hypothetical protein